MSKIKVTADEWKCLMDKTAVSKAKDDWVFPYIETIKPCIFCHKYMLGGCKECPFTRIYMTSGASACCKLAGEYKLGLTIYTIFSNPSCTLKEFKDRIRALRKRIRELFEKETA